MIYKTIDEWIKHNPNHRGLLPIEVCRQIWGTKDNEKTRVETEKPWVGLTRDEQSFVYSNLHNATSREDSFWVDFANALEARLKEKNT
jgi:hypothetical protein